MTENEQVVGEGGWLEASGLLPILRTLRLAVQPARLGIALVAIFLTLVLGWLLDGAVKTRGGVDPEAITRFIKAREQAEPYKLIEGKHGIFEVWHRHELRCIRGLLGSSLPGATVAAGTPVGSYLQVHSSAKPLRNFAGMMYGFWWLGRYHPLYFLCFGLGALLIWSLAGGAICRSVAVDFARDERLTAREAAAYGRRKWFGGFFFAPCIPIGIILVTLILLVAGGMMLRIPIVGDLIGGLAFGLAILGGFVIFALFLGLLIGGSLFWPAVAVEGSDAFDAFSRGVSYPLSKPWKAALYAVMTIVYAGLCWMFVNLFTFYMLKITRIAVGWGASWFGWWGRGEEGAVVSKLDILWPLSGLSRLYAWPDTSVLRWYEWFSAALIGLHVLIVIGLMWSFLASFYYAGSTVVYFLLRRDVDGTSLDDVYVEEEPEEEIESEEGFKPAEEGTPAATDDSPPATVGTAAPTETAGSSDQPDLKGPAHDAEPESASQAEPEPPSTPDTSDS